jgi:nucleotide-binding universal stress UspA family protein
MTAPLSPGRGFPVPARFLVGYDGSEPAQRAALFAFRLASATGAKVWLLYATDGSPGQAEPVTHEEQESRHGAIRSALRRLEEVGRSLGAPVESVFRDGPPAEALLAFARELPADFLLVGTRGLNLPERLVLGSVSSRVVVRARIPVTVVP